MFSPTSIAPSSTTGCTGTSPSPETPSGLPAEINAWLPPLASKYEGSPALRPRVTVIPTSTSTYTHKDTKDKH